MPRVGRAPPDRDTPRVAGQGPEYLYLSMQQYRNPQGKAKLPQPDKMLGALHPLSDQQLLALSHFSTNQRQQKPGAVARGRWPRCAEGCGQSATLES